MKDVGGGDKRQVNKSAICSVFARCLCSQTPLLLDCKAVGKGWGGSPQILVDTAVFAELTGYPNVVSGSHVSWQRLHTFTHWEKRTVLDKRKKETALQAQTTAANLHSTQAISHNVDMCQGSVLSHAMSHSCVFFSGYDLISGFQLSDSQSLPSSKMTLISKASEGAMPAPLHAHSPFPPS